MKKGTGCVADAIELRKVSIAVTALGPTVTAVFALIDSKTKTVVAWKKKSAGWPGDKVKVPLDELIKALEGAAAKEAFTDHEEEQTVQTIGEYLKKVETQF